MTVRVNQFIDFFDLADYYTMSQKEKTAWFDLTRILAKF